MSQSSSSAPRPRTRPVRTALVLLTAALAVLALAASASAAGARRGRGDEEITVLLQLRHPSGLAGFVRSVSDPRSPDYGDYLTVRALAERFGAPSKAKKTTMRWLRAHGARPKLSPTGTYVTARVPAAVAAYSLPRTGAHAPLGAAADLRRRIPATLRGIVTDVSTLGSKEGVFGSGVSTLAGGDSTGEPGVAGTSFFANTGTASGCAEGRAAELVPNDKGYTPNEYLDAYGHSKLQQSGYKGQGENVAVVETDGFRRSDIETFAKCFGLTTPKLVTRPVGIPRPLAPGDETTLDLEVLTATAPKLEHIYVYEGTSSEEGILHSAAAALGSKGHAPDAISISLGGCEAEEFGQIAFVESIDEVFAVAAGAGISVLVAAGDDGSTTCRRELESGLTALPLLSASDPATSPYVTAVGGTNFELTKRNTIKREVVWNDAPFSLGAGGGGFSILTTPRPWWQRGYLPGAGNGRIVPDVAGLADIGPGYAIYCTAAECRDPEKSPEAGWGAVGGTSAATPLYAGGVILADGYAKAHGAPSLGFLNPLVYELGRESRQGRSGGNVLADVTEGNNDLGVLLPADVGGGAPIGCCSASAGFDPASGWGSLDVANLAKVGTTRLRAAAARQRALAGALAEARRKVAAEARAKAAAEARRRK